MVFGVLRLARYSVALCPHPGDRKALVVEYLNGSDITGTMSLPWVRLIEATRRENSTL